jgi:hypothetical protein
MSNNTERTDMSEFHPSIAAVLQFFTWEHLPPHLQTVSKPIGELAFTLARSIPSSPELTVALRKLLEAKDAAVRAALVKVDHGRRDT